jgi:acetolactate synthase-1/2/3 large subunit
VLLITGGVERALAHRDRSKMFHGLDQAGFFRPIVRYYGCPRSALEIPRAVQGAFVAMIGARPGPAVLEIPPDVAAEEVADARVPDGVVPSRCPDVQPAHVERIAALVRSCRRPLVLVGGDVIACGAQGAVTDLAVLLNAPVIHTRLGKGAIPTSHPLNFGNSRHKRAKTLLREADLLLAIGVRFTQIDTANWQLPLPKRVIQLDRDPAEIGREIPVSDGIAAELGSVVTLLARTLGENPPITDWAGRLDEIQLAFKRPAVPVLSQIRRVLDPSGILVCDVTSLSYRGFDEYPVYGPRDFLYPSHYVTMGYGFPAAIGAKLACRERPVVALCGDGGVLMSIGELATVAQYNVPVVVVVVADGALLAIKASQIKSYGGRMIDTQLVNPDFVKLAESFGVAGSRAESLGHFESLLGSAIASDKPALIEVPMSDQEHAIMQQIPWLAGE